jgi:hypothetical protein
MGSIGKGNKFAQFTEEKLSVKFKCLERINTLNNEKL